MKNLEEIIIESVSEISSEKKAQGKEPCLVLDTELHQSIKKKVLETIRKLWKEQKIDVGRTINNNYIILRDENSPPRTRKVILHQQNLQ